VYRALPPKLYGADYLTSFGQYLVQHYFVALDGKRFILSDIAQDLPVRTDMHVLTLARMLNMLPLLVLDFANFCKFFVLFTLCIALQPHTTSQSEYRLLRLIVYR